MRGLHCAKVRLSGVRTREFVPKTGSSAATAVPYRCWQIPSPVFSLGGRAQLVADTTAYTSYEVTRERRARGWGSMERSRLYGPRQTLWSEVRGAGHGRADAAEGWLRTPVRLQWSSACTGGLGDCGGGENKAGQSPSSNRARQHGSRPRRWPLLCGHSDTRARGAARGREVTSNKPSFAGVSPRKAATCDKRQPYRGWLAHVRP